MLRSRYRRITQFFGRILLSLIWWEIILPRLGGRSWTRRTRSERLRSAARRFRNLAIGMGGVLIKVGQFLSTRVDVLPIEVTGELAGLQDEVPAEQFEDIRRVAESELGQPLAEKFAAFDPAPVAAASLGQVHRAVVLVSPPAGEEASNVRQNVVVKVQRPNIEQLIATDLAALRTVGGWLHRYPPINRRANVPALLDEFTRTLYEEIDYLAEGRNAETFTANFKDFPGLRVPAVHWTHTTRRVLTLEDVGAIKITDYAAIQAAGIDLSEVAHRLLETYLKQVFEDGFFHADPHPGNLFVTPLAAPAPEGGGKVEWLLTFVDFGMVGRVPEKSLGGIREALIALGMRDSARLLRAYQMLGVLLPSADLALLERANERAFEQFWGKSMTELQGISLGEMREFAHEFRELIFAMPFQVPQDLIFLARCVGILSGMCTGLDPQFNVWDELSPFAQKLIVEDSVNGRHFWLEELENIFRKLMALPGRTEAMLQKAERGELTVRDPHLDDTMRRLEGTLYRGAGALVFAAMLMGGIQLYLAGHGGFANALFFGALLALVWVIFPRRSRF